MASTQFPSLLLFVEPTIQHLSIYQLTLFSLFGDQATVTTKEYLRLLILMQDLQNIKNQLSSKNLFNAFKMQLIKDFEQSNFPADFVKALEPSYISIHKKIAFELQRNEKKSDFNLMQLLYRIDISEAQLKKYLNENKNESYFNVIAELIIKRVLQKVVIKHYYKNTGTL